MESSSPAFPPTHSSSAADGGRPIAGDAPLAIETRGLTKRFGQLVAVDQVDLAIRQGEIFGFLGPNGAGKSTTLRILCAIMRPSSGSARVGGHDVVQEPEAVKQQIGYMAQRFGLYEELTVSENIQFYAGVYLGGGKLAKRRTEEILASLALKDRRGELARNLSGGWKQRLALATALVHRPRILFLDEPTSGIDPVSRRQIWDILYGLAGEGVTLFVTTHYMEEAERCNTIGFIHQGRLVACGAPEELKEQPFDGDLVELEGPDLRHAFDRLKGRPEIRDMNFYGPSLHLILSKAEQELPSLLEEFRAEGLRIETARIIQPSIEDIFVRLTKENHS